MSFIITLVLVLLLLGWSIGKYNSIIKLRNRIDNAWQNIDTQLQRRCDMIPNLVETVKGYATHERETLEAVIAARNATIAAPTPEDKMTADLGLSGALRQLLAVSENYPDLKADVNFRQLQTSLEDTENKITYARQSYNDCVLNFNNAIQTFPGNLFARVFKFEPRIGFAAAEDAHTVPQVKF